MLPPMSISDPLRATPRGDTFVIPWRTWLRRRQLTETWLGTAALFGVTLAVLVITISAAGTNSLLPESVRPVPRWLAGPFGTTGINLGRVGLAAVLAAMFACYVVAVRYADRLSGRTVLTTIAAVHALVLLAPPLISTDVFSYQAYAKMGVLYGSNPYLHGPHVIALDPLYPFVGANWISTPTTYGPLFTLMSYLLVPLSIAGTVLAYKTTAAVASLCSVALVWNAARRRGLDPAKAAAVVGLNPLVVVYGVGGAHNDLLMLAAMCAGIYGLLSHRERSGGAATVLAAGIKLTGGVLLPFALASGNVLGAPRRRRDIALGALAAAAAILIASFLAFGTGLFHLPSTLRQSQDSAGDWHCIPGLITTRLGLGSIGHTTGLILGIAFVCVCAWLVYRVWLGAMDWIDGAGWATLAMLASASSLQPWYFVWLLPMLALCADRRLWRWGTVVGGLMLTIQLVGYVPDGSALL
jgi:Glycosyltransferase family 87